MRAYSHSDRLRDPDSTLSRAALQRATCAGDDPSGYPAEVYTFRDAAARWGSPPRSASAVGLPRWLLLNRARFRYLLPGGCVREARPPRPAVGGALPGAAGALPPVNETGFF